MDRIGGWNVWTKSGTRIRQFTVVVAAEKVALAALKADNPDLELFSCHPVNEDTIRQLGMTDGDITEWVPLDCKEKLRRVSVPFGTDLKN